MGAIFSTLLSTSARVMQEIMKTLPLILVSSIKDGDINNDTQHLHSWRIGAMSFYVLLGLVSRATQNFHNLGVLNGILKLSREKCLQNRVVFRLVPWEKNENNNKTKLYIHPAKSVKGLTKVTEDDTPIITCTNQSTMNPHNCSSRNTSDRICVANRPFV